MTRARKWLLIGPAMALAGLMLVVTFAPRAKAAADHGRSPATHQLWVCSGEVSCRPRGKPQGQTACLLDAASEANVLPKGSRVSCQRTAK
jgi:hypothetical protein